MKVLRTITALCLAFSLFACSGNKTDEKATEQTDSTAMTSEQETSAVGKYERGDEDPNRARYEELSKKLAEGYKPKQSDYQNMLNCASYVMHEMDRAKKKRDIDALVAIPADYPYVDTFLKILEKASTGADGYEQLDATRMDGFKRLAEFISQTEEEEE